MSLMDLADGSLNAQSREEKLAGALKLHTSSHTIYPPFFERKVDS